MSEAGKEPTASEIRRVALEMFGDVGYDGSSIRGIALAVGIKGPSMYKHFGSKEEILWALTSAAFDSLHAGWNEARQGLVEATPIDRVRGFVRAHVRYHAEQHREAAIINAQLAKLSEEHYQAAVALRRQYEQILTDLVEECLATGTHDVPNLRVTVFAILQMATAVSTWYRPDGPLAIEDLCETYATLAVKMLSRPTGPEHGR